MKRNCRNLFWETVTFAVDDKVKSCPKILS